MISVLIPVKDGGEALRRCLAGQSRRHAKRRRRAGPWRRAGVHEPGRLRHPRVLAGLVLLAVLLRLPTLGYQSLWYDEKHTVDLMQYGFADMMAKLTAETSPALFYVVEWGWTQIFGSSDFAMRLLPALFGVATVPVAYAVGRAFMSRRGGMVFAAFAATNPVLVWYSQEARPYSLLILLSGLSLLALARALHEPTSTRLALWALTAAAVMTTQFFGIFLAAAEGVWLLVALRGHRYVVTVILVQLTLLLVALLPVLYGSRGIPQYIGRLPLDDRLMEVGRAFLVGVSPPTQHLVIPLALLACFAIVTLALLGNGREKIAVLVVGGIGTLAIVLSVLAGSKFVLAKNEMATWFPLMGAVAMGLAVQRLRWLGVAGATAVCGLFFAAVVLVQANDDLQKPAWRDVAAALGPMPRDGRLLIVPNNGVTLLQFYLRQPTQGTGPFYGPAGNLTSPPVIRAPKEIALVAYRSPSGRAMCWSGAACNIPSLSAPAKPPRGYREIDRHRVGLFTIVRYRAPQPQLVDIVALGGVQSGPLGVPPPPGTGLLQPG